MVNFISYSPVLSGSSPSSILALSILLPSSLYVLIYAVVSIQLMRFARPAPCFLTEYGNPFVFNAMSAVDINNENTISFTFTLSSAISGKFSTTYCLKRITTPARFGHAMDVPERRS